MIRFMLGRLALAIPTLFIVTLAVFAMVRAIPGDPASAMLGDLATPEMVARLKASMGIDKPLPVQYVIWLGDVVSGDFGRSIGNDEPVGPLIWERFKVSASIVLLAVALASMVAVPAGMIAAWRQGTATDLGLIGVATLLLSIPSFWLGLMILLVFGLGLGWFPILGSQALSGSWREWAAAIAMPVLTLFLVEMGSIVRMSRAATIDVLRQEYITHARAKGLSESAVMWRHAFRNAFAPTWTLIGLILGALLGGIAVVETVFTIPGLGRLLVEGIYTRDYPVVQGCILMIAFVYVVVNLIVDMAYPFFDPKVAR
ncbi:ABC transporter permease [Chachezhania antarctica]|uniref:ABC transporter permease n=1 Tax=Chachezhania antarctica TaxID=2340860 RepID=UPI000EB05CD9|nr:ABC transporter permease [Chachezhania antarctica]|tara:strand:+ start:2889 stop:3830 length:942 start_codon:yes stop_codon:yes gene_type:complete